MLDLSGFFSIDTVGAARLGSSALSSLLVCSIYDNKGDQCNGNPYVIN